MTQGEPVAIPGGGEGERVAALRQAKEVAEKIFHAVREPLVVLDSDLRVVSLNESFRRTFDVGDGETVGLLVYELGNGQWDIPELRELLERILPHRGVFNDFRVEHDFERIGRRTMLLNARRIDALQLILLAIEDITSREHSRRAERDFRGELERTVQQRTALLKLLQDVVVAANGARTLEEALHAAVRRISLFNRWRLGHAYLLAGDGSGELAPTGIWHVDGEDRFEPFRRATARKRFKRGEGLVGRVAATGEPLWVDDLRKEPRVHWRADLPLRAAFMFPITVDERVVGVMEFYSDEPLSREERFQEMMRNVGIQLGHLVERKTLEKRVAGMTEQEQRRLGQELHDSVSQHVAGAMMLAKSLQQKLEQRVPGESERARRLVGSLEEAQRQIRGLARGLLPVDVDAEGLMTALGRLAEAMAHAYGIRCDFECDEAVPVEDNFVATHLYRIAQEALYNALRHAGASRVTVKLEERMGWVRLSVRDDGEGFSAPPGLDAGMGLRIMRYRAGLIGAELDIDSEPGRGTTVTCTLAPEIDYGHDDHEEGEPQAGREAGPAGADRR